MALSDQEIQELAAKIKSDPNAMKQFMDANSQMSTMPAAPAGGLANSFGQGIGKTLSAVPSIMMEGKAPPTNTLSPMEQMYMQDALNRRRAAEKETGTQNVTTMGAEGSAPVTVQVPKGKVLPDPNQRVAVQDQKTWNGIVKQIDVLAASSRSGLGMAVNANIRANRALSLLNKDITTPQEMQSIAADLAGIFQGGAPTDIGLHEQAYKTLQKQAAQLQQYITANPSNAMSPEIKQRLKGVVTELKKLDSDLIDSHFGYYEEAYPDLIARKGDTWEKMKNKYKQSALQTPGLGGETTTEPSVGGTVDYKSKYGLK